MATWCASPITIRTAIARRTGILDEALPAFKLLKLKDIAIDFDDIQDIELRGRAYAAERQGSASRAALTAS